jgi:hypothetical protein
MARNDSCPMDSTFHIISKLDAAERQLRQAVRLFFQRGDDVAIHTLAAASYQIISDLCKHKGIQREMEDSSILEGMGVKGEVLAAVRKPQNFFKHADKDPEGNVRFNPLLNACLIMYAVQYFYSITGKQFPEGQVFRVWFFLRFPDRMPPDVKALFSKIPNVASPDDYTLFLDLIGSVYASQ